MKLSVVGFGDNADIVNGMLQFISEAAKKFLLDAGYNIEIPPSLKNAIFEGSDEVILLSFKSVKIGISYKALIGFRHEFFSLDLITDHGVRVTSIVRASSVSPKLQRRLIEETLLLYK